MKRNALFIAFVMLFMILPLAGGCGVRDLAVPETSAEVSKTPDVSQSVPPVAPATTGEATPKDTAAAVISEEAQSPESSAESDAPEGEALTYKTVTYEDGKITIKYPEFTNITDNGVQKKVNELISSRALKVLKDLEGQAVEYELDYAVTFLNPDVISVAFHGYMNYEQAAHPSNVFYTINIDVKNQSTISLSQLVYVNDRFVELFKKGELSSMLFDMDPEIEASLNEYLFQSDMLDWPAELSNADSEGGYTFSYLTEEALGISVSVPHVYGDHVEISLTYEQLVGYQTDNEIWFAITPDAYS